MLAIYNRLNALNSSWPIFGIEYQKINFIIGLDGQIQFCTSPDNWFLGFYTGWDVYIYIVIGLLNCNLYIC